MLHAEYYNQSEDSFHWQSSAAPLLAIDEDDENATAGTGVVTCDANGGDRAHGGPPNSKPTPRVAHAVAGGPSQNPGITRTSGPAASSPPSKKSGSHPVWGSEESAMPQETSPGDGADDAANGGGASMVPSRPSDPRLRVEKSADRDRRKKRKYFCSPENLLRLLVFSCCHFLDYWSNIGATTICFYWCYKGSGGTFSAFTGGCGVVVILAAGCFSAYLAFRDKYFFRFSSGLRAFFCIVPMGFFQGQIYKLAFHRYIRRKNVSGDFAASSEGSPYEVLSSSIPGFRFHTKAFLGVYESVFFAGSSAFMMTRDIQKATEELDAPEHPLPLELWEKIVLTACLSSSLWTLAHVCVEVDYRVGGGGRVCMMFYPKNFDFLPTNVKKCGGLHDWEMG